MRVHSHAMPNVPHNAPPPVFGLGPRHRRRIRIAVAWCVVVAAAWIASNVYLRTLISQWLTN